MIIWESGIDIDIINLSCVCFDSYYIYYLCFFLIVL